MSDPVPSTDKKPSRTYSAPATPAAKPVEGAVFDHNKPLHPNATAR
jgi:hypothetical protein